MEKYFPDANMLHQVMEIAYQQGEGQFGIDVFKEFLVDVLGFNASFATQFSNFVMHVNDDNSRAWMIMHARSLRGSWRRGNSDGSAGNLVVSNMETWTFDFNLTYENKTERYEGLSNPFGGGYSRPSSSSRGGHWAPCGVKTDTPQILLIPFNGSPYTIDVDFTDQDAYTPTSCLISGRRYSRV